MGRVKGQGHRGTKPRHRNARNVYACISPNGKTYITYDLPQFCSVEKLSYSAMVNCANAWITNHKGWKCEHFQHFQDSR